VPGSVAVSTRALTKRFGRRTAVDRLDLEVRTGEIFGFLGPNGAGKTTTIRMLLDFLRPTSGTVTVLGGTGADLSVRARIGYLPADLAVPPRYSARDVVDLFGGLRDGVDETRFAALVERFVLEPDRPSGELSTGNRRKIGIVQAFVHRPDLLILDEPTSGLDPLLQHEFHGLVRESVAEGATVLLSSHVLPEVQLLADRVGILRSGRLVATARPDDLRTRSRQRIELRLAPDAATDDELARAFGGVAGVVGVEAQHGVVRLVVEGSVDDVVKAAARWPVEALTAEHEDLEDTFLGFYEEADAPAEGEL
jgi:ABC-2 type transport system ATP-binding protein